ncbi:MAG: hypothetical protein KKC46_11230 [Proteobacteria bacterium]|nr:hypothetical protein [Pseudomonadota bacterium]
MAEENKLNDLLKDKVINIDGVDYRLDDVAFNKDKDGKDLESLTLMFAAVENPQKTINMVISDSTLLLLLSSLFSFQDISECFVDEVESVANEISEKYKPKIIRGLSAFIEEFKKK